MSSITSAGSTTQTAESYSASSQNEGFSELNIDEFLQLLITEMQNQDPMDPMENSEMLQQIGQIREIGATDQLTSTLGNLAASQELVTASGLIGRQVEALADDSTEVSGVVDRITVQTNEDDSRNVKVHVGEKTIDIRNIRQIDSV
ncbi:flagellar hook assembly protein FlgD [Roseimaritima ulvae]|uniref:Basal-body rod modification protein FlgD n=1 Tax=Roseimaritima ulvae TaxID=980254 RepID=A0A5B9QUN4_9BACT|nr:flagellar hook capping FlgD N-terminal domain-containing protein [Roseimaritima ulvae]QEG42738.1 Basal-body rod modification protein FlgD [Roseimaritima ulvae]